MPQTIIKALSLTLVGAFVLTGCAPSTPMAPEQITPDPEQTAAPDEDIINNFEDFPSLDAISLSENPNKPDVEPLASMEEYYSQSIDWYECTETMECGYVWVPTDYDNLADGMTYIAMVRKESSGDGKAKGSILANPGGPGASGVDLVFNAGTMITTEQVRESYDLIGFDPRGVGYSDSVYCGPGEVEDVTLLDPGKQYPLGSKEDILDTRQERAYFAEACARGTEAGLLQNVDTISAAKDMDIMRAAVNDDKLHYLGFSYGSQLGATYAALFPDRVGKMVLDGAIDPTVSSEESSIRQAAGFELAFNNYVDDCLANKDCPVPGSTRADIKNAILDLLLSIEESPLPTDLDNDLAIWPAIIGIIRPLYSQGLWSDLTVGIREAVEGDGTVLLRSAYLYFERSNSGEYYTNIGPANLAINCLDDRYSNDPAIIAETNAAIEEAAPFFSRYFSNPYLGCAEWPYTSSVDPRTLNYEAELSAPVLVIGTTGDPATPFRNAVALAELLNPGILLTHEGEGHTVYANNNTCVDDIVDTYFLTGEVPTGELVCSD